MIIRSKHDGWVHNVRRVYGGGGDSGPTNQKVEQTNIPEYARPYVEDMLGRSQALSTQNPYQQYGGQRVAGADALQNQSYQAAANMQPSGHLGMASEGAQGVYGRAGQVSNFTPGQYGAFDPSGYAVRDPGNPMMTRTGAFNDPGVAQSYMNPYMQQVVDIQKREAARQSAIMGENDNAQATHMGAFGGSRNAIVQAERERNLNQQLDDIQARGGNAAWTQAMQAFQADAGRGLQSQMANQGAGLTASGQRLQADTANLGAASEYGRQALQGANLTEQSRQYGAGLGLQGLQTQLGASQLARDIGQNEYNQRLGIVGLQNQFGTQRQTTEQMELDAAAQEFENRNMWPYKQLEFQNAMVRGLPLNQTTTSMYEAPPSAMSQLVGAGTALYGMSRMAAGGIVDAYAAGGYVADEDDGGRVVKYDTSNATTVVPKPGRNVYRGRMSNVIDDTGARLLIESDNGGAGRGEKNPPRSKRKYAKGGEVGGGLADLLISQIN